MRSLKIHSLNRWDWPENIMIHAAFQCLVDFVEKHADIIDWDSDKYSEKIWAEIQELYKWWTEERPKREALERGDESSLECTNEECKEDQKNFHRLIEIRTAFWV